MKTSIAVAAVLLAVGLASSYLLFSGPQSRGEITTFTHTATATLTVTSTKFTSVEKPGYGLPDLLLQKLSQIQPDYDTKEAYHVYVPDKPGTYSYGFAVFWKYGINHTHLIFFHVADNRRIVFGPSSFVQTRFVAAKNIPNIEASVIPRAYITETVITGGGETFSKSWQILPNIPGYPSTPQIERNVGDIVWIISYAPLEQRPYGESLVARYYFLEIIVSG